MILIAFLCEVLKDIKPELWSRMYLSYDNMYFFSMFYILYDTQLSSGAMLKLLKEALPLVGEFSKIWLNIGKCIDPLHIKNHKVKWLTKYSYDVFNNVVIKLSYNMNENILWDLSAKLYMPQNRLERTGQKLI